MKYDKFDYLLMDIEAAIESARFSTLLKQYELTNKIESTIMITSAILATLIIIFGIAILWNQRKIKKMLRQIQDQNQDKPQE